MGSFLFTLLLTESFFVPCLNFDKTKETLSDAADATLLSLKCSISYTGGFLLSTQINLAIFVYCITCLRVI